MKIAIVGGKLQGTEAVYLASLAGYESILIDINPEVQASGFCDEFLCGDIVKEEPHVIEALKKADFVLPANENTDVLNAVKRIARRENLKVAFDFDAYQISSSKLISDKLFEENDIPAPTYYPQGRPPYIAKPSGESGSQGVTLLETRDEAEAFLASCGNPESWVIQEYVQGPSYSIEVIGNGREYRTYTVTQIHMDDKYDCCMVTAPCEIGEEKIKQFRQIGEKIADVLKLKGMMDVEVIDDGENLKVLEIDARIPSQTPIAVYYSSGDNLLEELADVTVYGEFKKEKKDEKHFCAYEHYEMEENQLMRDGEHAFSQARPLRVSDGLFSSQKVISDFEPGKSDFRGVFINWADSYEELHAKRMKVKKELEAYEAECRAKRSES